MVSFERGGLSVKALCAGQAISLCIAGTSVFTEYLSSHSPPVSIPLVLSSITYALLALHLVYRYFRDGRRWQPLKVSWWKYAIFALIDLEANYLVIKAYMFTSMASVALLDAFSIPCSVFLSYIFLSVRYGKRHIYGVLLCAAGLGLSFASDLVAAKGGTGGEEKAGAYNNAIWGDALCLLGALLYATSNVLQESVVKTMDRVEYLGMLGFFGTIFAWIQMTMFESQELANENFSSDTIVYVVGFSVCLFSMYVATSWFLTFADSALFNMSLLTADFYIGMLFIWLFQGKITPLNICAYVFIGIGLLVYGREPLSTAGKESSLLQHRDGGEYDNIRHEPLDPLDEDGATEGKL